MKIYFIIFRIVKTQSKNINGQTAYLRLFDQKSSTEYFKNKLVHFPPSYNECYA